MGGNEMVYLTSLFVTGAGSTSGGTNFPPHHRHHRVIFFKGHVQLNVLQLRSSRCMFLRVLALSSDGITPVWRRCVSLWLLLIFPLMNPILSETEEDLHHFVATHFSPLVGGRPEC